MLAHAGVIPSSLSERIDETVRHEIAPIRLVLVGFILVVFALRYPFPEIRNEVPKIFSKALSFLTADSSARIGTRT